MSNGARFCVTTFDGTWTHVGYNLRVMLGSVSLRPMLSEAE